MENQAKSLIFFAKGSAAADLKGLELDLVVVSPESDLRRPASEKNRPRCRYGVIPGERSTQAVSAVALDYVMSYGMSERDTVTVSSIDSNGMILALQREIVTIGGKVLEQQELPIRTGLSSPGAAMAASCALLMLGVPPEKLCDKNMIV